MMSPTLTFRAALLGALTLATPALSDITISGAYARSSGPTAKSGAAFFVIHNDSAQDDRLIGAASGVAKRVELHTHIDAGNGVMQMRHDEDGFEVPAMGMHALKRGADHVMFMGLTMPMVQGAVFDVTLTFEHAGEITITVPVDLERTPEMAMQMGTVDHSAMAEGDMDHSMMDETSN